MGMSSEEHIYQLKKLRSYHNGSYGASINYAIDTIRKYKQFKSDYRNRLCKDLAAILTDLLIDVEELDLEDVVPEYQDGAEQTREYIANILEEKINALKGDPHD